MTDTTPSRGASPESSVHCAVLDNDDFAVVRISGRGNFQNSVHLKRFADHLQKGGHPESLVLDLANCETLDSTFMGVMAAVSIAQTRAERHKLIVLNANDHVRRLLKTLGLGRLLDIRDSVSQEDLLGRAKEQMQPADEQPVSRLDQLLHTLDAHKTLVKIDEENELRFQSVIHYLEQSLKNIEDEEEPGHGQVL